MQLLNPKEQPPASGLLLNSKIDNVSVVNVVTIRFVKNAQVADFLIFSLNNSSGVIKRY